MSETASSVYQQLVAALVSLGYDRLTTTWSFRDVPEEESDRKFQVLPGDVEAQQRSSRAGCVETLRAFRVAVLYGSLAQTSDVVEGRVLPDEERITNALLDLSFVETVSCAYSDTDELGGRIVATFTVQTSYDRLS